MSLHGFSLLMNRLREHRKFDAAMHDKELKEESYASDDEVAGFFERLANRSK